MDDIMIVQHFIQKLAFLIYSISLSLKRQYLFLNIHLRALPAKFNDYFTEVNNVYKRTTQATIKELLYFIRKNIKIVEFY